MIRETGREVFGGSSGQRMNIKDNWERNEKVQQSIQRKVLSGKKWDSEKTEESRREYNEMQHKAKRKLEKATQKVYASLMRSWTLRKEKRICIVWRGSGIELEGCEAESGD